MGTQGRLSQPMQTARFLHRDGPPQPTEKPTFPRPLPPMQLDTRPLALLLALTPLGSAFGSPTVRSIATPSVPTLRKGPSIWAAPTSARQTEGQTSSLAEDLAAPAKRVLLYHGGHAIRGLARRVDSHWEVRRDGKWATLYRGPIQSHRLEVDLLREARRLAEQAPREDLVARNVHAAWLIRVGLHAEAKEELDGILTQDPDCADALAQIQAPAFLAPRTKKWLDAPGESAKTMIAAGEAAGPVQRELLINSLGNLQQAFEESGGLREILVRSLHSTQLGQRSFAAHALRRLFPGQELLPLMQRCVLDVSEPVRRESALAVRMAQQPELALPLVKALGSKSRAIRTNATESLGIIGYKNAVPALVKHYAGLSSAGGVMPITSHIRIGAQLAYIQDFDLEIAQGASIADPIVRSAHDVVQLEARVGGISGYTYVTEKRTIYQSLKQLTGEDPGSSPKAWNQWFEKQGESFR